MMIKHLKNSLILLSFFYIARFIKVNVIIGSKIMYFSFISMTPVLGLFFGAFQPIYLILMQSMYRIVFCNGGITALHLPTILSFWFLQSKYYYRKLFLIFVCAMLFLWHPVGWQSWFYTLYWIIPCIITVAHCSSIFLRMLATTFVAHAVGSVIWVYSVPLHYTDFISLMPIVPFERLIYATAMTLLYYILELANLFMHYRGLSKKETIQKII